MGVQMKLNREEPFAELWGHPRAKYEQGGVLFDGRGDSLEPITEEERSEPFYDPKVPDEVRNGWEFLKHVLREGPVAKGSLYREAELNNQNWQNVRGAAALMGIVSTKVKGVEMWRLPESVEA